MHAVFAQSAAPGDLTCAQTVEVRRRANAMTGARLSTWDAASDQCCHRARESAIAQNLVYGGHPRELGPAAIAQVSAAIDRLAAAVEGLLGHAIP